MNSIPPREHSPIQQSVWVRLAPVLPPIGWFIYHLVIYSLVPQECARGTSLLLPVLSLAALLLTASAGAFAWRNWQATGHTWPDDAAGVPARSRFLIVLAILSSGLFFLVILAQGIPTLILSPCQP